MLWLKHLLCVGTLVCGCVACAGPNVDAKPLSLGVHRPKALLKEDLLRTLKVDASVARRAGAAYSLVCVHGFRGPDVVAGLVDAPVVAVPTSVGYGASFKGLAALLAMLNACASGVGVVNIDNGFGAAHLACLILRGRTPGARQG